MDTNILEETLTDHRILSNQEQRALDLLGDGHSQEIVAATLGVTPGRVSQWMSDSWFANEVSNKRFEKVQEATVRDRKIDGVEDKLLAKLEKSLPLISKTGELVRAFQILNQAKRRGSPTDTTAALINQTVVNLTLPVAIVNKYKTNEQAQVIEVNDKPFLTAPSHMLPEISTSAITRAKENEQAARQHTQTSVPIKIRGQEVCAEDL